MHWHSKYSKATKKWELAVEVHASPPAPDVVQYFKPYAVRLLSTSCKDKNRARNTQLVNETEVGEKTAAPAKTIISAVSAKDADKLGELLLVTNLVFPFVGLSITFSH